MRRIRKIVGMAPLLKLKRVAAYARVSADTEQTEKSFSTQVSYFSQKIQSNPEWIYAGVYSDLGISGTNTAKRRGFRQMIQDAEAGKIDIILTKSIQRFARNTVDLLQTIRHLKDLGVEVRFEKENISTMSGDGEVMLTILASFAQAESLNMSTNIRWAFRKKNEQGIPNQHFIIYGYRWEGDTLVPEPEEAAVVRKIYKEFLAGKSLQKIADELLAKGKKTFYGKDTFLKKTIANMLQNITYTGTMLLQKGFVVSPLTKKRKRNEGELPQYKVEEDHEAIIDMDTFTKVQELIQKKQALGVWANPALNLTLFTGVVKCPHCHKSYRRHIRSNGAVYWECMNRKNCPVAGSIREETLRAICREVLETDDLDASLRKAVDHIEIPKSHTLQFFLANGKKVTRHWRDIPAAETWTEERRQKRSEQNRLRAKYLLSGKLICPTCGKPLIHMVTAKGVPFWNCRTCRGYSVKKFSDENLQMVISKALEVPPERLREVLDHAEVFPDGHIICIKYKEES